MFRSIVSKTVSQACTFRVTRACLSSAAPSAPSVKDLLIDLTFVDPSGARRKVKGLVGTYAFVADKRNLRIALKQETECFL
jgi:hypothetical protein